MNETKESKQERDARKEAARATRRVGWALFSVVAVVLIVFALVWTANRTGSPTDGVSGVNLAPIAEADHLRGATSSPKAVLVEYSDFQCPACAGYEPMIQDLVATYGNQGLVLVYRHYPLPQHNKALLMARAAEAAGEQGRFWEMHDLIFVDQEKWANLGAIDAQKTVEGYAGQLKLNLSAFSKALNSKKVEDKIKTDMESGRTALVVGTPTFFLNGQEVSARTTGDFAKQIEVALMATTTNAQTAF